MKKYLIIFLFSLIMSNDFQNFGSFIFNSNSSESLSMCDATVSWINGANSISSNPAGLTSLGYKNIIQNNFSSDFINGFSFEFGTNMETLNVGSYSDTQFPYIALGWGMGIKNVPDLYLGLGMSFQSITVGSVEEWTQNEQFVGYFNYSESAISAAFSIEYSPVRVGLKWINFIQNMEIDGQLNNFDDMKNNYFLPSEFGVQYSINKNWDLGLLISKSTKLGLYDMTLSRSKVGISHKYYNNDKIEHLVAIDFEKSSNDFGNIKLGYQYLIAEGFLLRTGLRSELVQEDDNWDILNSLIGSIGLSFKVLDLSTGKPLVFNMGLKQHIYPTITSPLSRTFYFSISYKNFN